MPRHHPRAPRPCGNRFCHALADAYATGAAAAGHNIARIAQIEFPILRTQKDFETGQMPDALMPARDAIVAAQHLLIIFPLRHGTMPALLKAFIEQVLRPGVALEYREGGFPRRLLAGRSARLVVTMGMPDCSIDGTSEHMGCAALNAACSDSPA
jgi:putative NADPH-quinone reductase